MTPAEAVVKATEIVHAWVKERTWPDGWKPLLAVEQDLISRIAAALEDAGMTICCPNCKETYTGSEGHRCQPSPTLREQVEQLVRQGIRCEHPDKKQYQTVAMCPECIALFVLAQRREQAKTDAEIVKTAINPEWGTAYEIGLRLWLATLIERHAEGKG